MNYYIQIPTVEPWAKSPWPNPPAISPGQASEALDRTPRVGVPGGTQGVTCHGDLT